MLFISGNGLISKQENRELTLDLQALRNELLDPSDYYYNILIWKSVSISYRNTIRDLSLQKIDLFFRNPQGNVSPLQRNFQLPQYFIGNLEIEYLRIYDRDKGNLTFRKNELDSIPQLQLEIDLPERPTSEIVSVDSPTVVELQSGEIENWKEGFKARIQDGASLTGELLTITSVDIPENKVTFDVDPLAGSLVGKDLVFASNQEISLEQLIDFKDS